MKTAQSSIHKIRVQLHDRDFSRLQEEARIANDLQKSEGITRTEALKIAKHLLEKQP